MHRLLPLLLILAFATGCASDDNAKPRNVSVTLTGGTAVDAGTSARLSGAVDETNAKVALYADVHPFDRPRFVRRLEPNGAGRFTTRVKPTRNTRYWALAVGHARGKSGQVNVDVGIEPKLRLRATTADGTKGLAQMVWRVRGERLVPVRNARACVYVQLAGYVEWGRVGCAAVLTGLNGSLIASVPIVAPKQGDDFGFCASKDVAEGFREYTVTGCGEKTLESLDDDALH